MIISRKFKYSIDIIDLKSDMGLSHNEFGFTQNAWNRQAIGT